MPKKANTAFGRSVPKLADPRAQQEIDNLYYLLQNRKITDTNIDDVSVAGAVGKVMKDGQLEILNRFMRAGTRAKALYIVQDEPLPKGNPPVEARALVVSRLIPNPQAEAVYFGHDALNLPTFICEAVGRGSAAWFKRTNATATPTSDSECVLRLEHQGNGKNLLVRNVAAAPTARIVEITNGSVGSPGTGPSIYDVRTGANLTLGMFNNGSSAALKEDFQKLDSAQVLEKVKKLRVENYRFIGSKTRHIGPVAEDFNAAFKVGTDKTIAANDLAAVALLSIQSLVARVEALEKRVAQLEKR